MVLKRTFKCLTAVSSSTDATVWCRLTGEEAEAELEAAYVFTVQR